MQRYIGTKLLNGMTMNRLDYNNFRGWLLPEDEDGTDEGYLVECLDGGEPNTEEYEGYVSWSPKEQLENAYRKTEGLNFGLAIEAMKKGMKVTRMGWNGKCMFIYLVEGTVVPVEKLRGSCAEAVAMSNNTAPVQDICGHIDMLAADGSVVVGWLASQTDMLADDYIIVE